MNSLTSKEKWSYAVGNIPFSVKEAAFTNFVVFYYTQVLGLSGSLAGIAMFISLLWDGISDPVVGSWSDQFRSRWGRRHPLLVAGSIPSVLLFLALFSPPDGLTEIGVFIWLLFASALLRTTLTIYFIPYTAMGAELSNHYDERTTIAKARVTCGWIAGMLLPAVGFSIFFQPVDGIDGRLVKENYIHYGIMSAGVAALAAWVCIAGTRSVIPRLPVSLSTKGFSWKDPITDFRSVYGNRNFRISIGSNLSFGMSTGAYATLSLYLATYLWELSSAQLAGLVIPTALATLLAFTTLGPLSRRLDKPTVLVLCSLGLAANTCWLFGGRLLNILPPPGDDALYLLIALNTCIGVFMVVSLQVVSASLAADILDQIELETGLRREGVVFSVGAFVSKATIGAGALIAGIVVELSGILPSSVPGAVGADVLNSLTQFSLFILAGFALLALVFIKQLKLSRIDHELIQTRLREHSATPA